MKQLVVPVTNFQQNCTFVLCEHTDTAAIIDPGGDTDKLMTIVAKHQLNVDRILLTHGHLDHAGGAAILKERLSVPIIGPHKDDAFWLDQLPQQSSMLGLMPPIESFTPDQWLEDGHTVTVGTIEFEVIHCPGHTPGHVVYFNRKANWAQVGDVLFAGSIGRTDFPRGNLEDLTDSIRGKLFPLGDNVTFIPGHGPSSTFGQERRHNPFVADHRYG